ncbi:MAG TPA: NotI family restriction endonuclease [Ktedonobacteraceae bacterium]|nr:NotI family restriction endonuclease [Ktedonobacteraceae bacterium]
MTKVLELYGVSTRSDADTDWETIVERERCPYLQKKCIKIRKSRPDITIGTCSMLYGKESKEIIICPFRLLERRQVFTDCLHLLTLHEPGNELHIIPEVSIPGGNVDYFLVSVRNNEIKDFVGIELQTLDTTGTTWPDRQRFIQEKGIKLDEDDTSATSVKTFGMNWKMTAKTTLIQLHHKVQTFQEIDKHLVLVIQDHFMNYIKREFRFDHLNQARLGDSAHIHVYRIQKTDGDSPFRLELDARFSTDANGVAESLGLQTDSKMELAAVMKVLKAKLSERTLFTL